jgi:CRISPR-associated protein Cas1
MLSGRLGIEIARAPHADRHGVLYVEHCKVAVEDGCITFETSGFEGLEAGRYVVPFQTVSALLLGPGSSVSHDVMRIAGSHGMLILAVGTEGVRLYSCPPLGADSSELARRQVRVWADPDTRLQIARRLYAWKLGEVLPSADITVLRGIEGARAKESYKVIADRFHVEWHGRRFDRDRPDGADVPNQAINYASTCVYAAAGIAVAVTRTIPQLGFIHEASGEAFVLDIADLFRDDITLPVAFMAVTKHKTSQLSLDKIVRRECGAIFRKERLIAGMIEKINNLLGMGDDSVISRDK